MPTAQTRLEQDIQYKQALREQVAQQLEGDMQRFKDMEREAAALISKARHANSKLMVRKRGGQVLRSCPGS
jgi:formyltetrahydrofolate hydrolase